MDDGARTTAQALFLGSWAQLEAAAARRLAELRRDDPLRPLTVVCGSAAAASHLRRSLTRRSGGLVAVDFTTIHRLASHLAAAPLRERGMSSLEEVESLRVLAAVVTRVGAASYFSRIRSMPGLPRALQRTFSDLRDAQVTPAQLASLGGESAAELAALYGEYIGVLGHADRADDVMLYEAAAWSVTERYGTLSSSWVGVYGLYDLPEPQRAFLRALAHGRQLEAFLPGPADAAYSAPAREFFLEVGCSPEPPGSLVSGYAGDLDEPAVEIVSVEDAAAERREMLRRVVAAAEQGRSFHDVAVVHADAGWRGLFIEDLEARGIPVAAQVRRPSLSSGVVSSLLACVAPLSGPSLERAALVDLASACALLDRCAPVDVARWDRLSRDARVVGGADQWHARLAATVDRRRSSATAVVALLGFVDEIEALRGAAQELFTWPSLADWLASALVKLGIDPDDSAVAAVRRLGRLADIESHVGVDAFAAIARDLVTARSERLGSLGRIGVAVVSPEQIRGVRVPLVLFGGLVEGLFPPRPAPDPLLSDDDRVRLAASSGARLATAALRSQESDVLFALTRGAATASLVFLRARSREGSGAPQLPSRHLLTYCSELNGERLAFSSLDTAGAVGGRVTRVAASPMPHLGWPGEVLGVDERDVDAAALTRLQRSGDRRLTEDYLSALLGPRDAVRRLVAQRSRRDPQLTAWDGLIEDPGLPEAVLGRELSVSAIEAYLDCPFVFYTRYILRASAVQEPEEAFEARALDVGLLVHRVLERVFSALRDADQHDRRAASAALEAATADVFARAELEGLTGYPLAWEGQRRRLSADLRQAVATDPCWHGDLQPRYFEWSFGGDTPGPVVEVGGRPLRFRGRVDRIDCGGDGDHVRLLDYKTGKGKAEQKDLENGDDVQLPVYRLAASALTPAPSEVDCAFRLVTRAGGFRMLTLPGDLEQSTQALVERLAEFVAGVEAGVFLRRHGSSRCRWCDLAYVCGACTARDADKQADARFSSCAEREAGGDA
jgi:ATP-dependent helicase/nuclease subunit B